MVLKHSNLRDLPAGSPAPPFTLLEPLTGEHISLASVAGQKGTLVAFLSCHCPFVVHLHDTIRRLAVELPRLGVEMVAISANDVTTHPDDAPDKMAALAQGPIKGVRFLFDESQDVAKAYRASHTPDWFLFDANLELVYRGRVDGSTPGNGLPSDGGELLSAAERLSKAEPIDWDSIRPSMGCSIKWKPGCAPDYM